MTLKHTVSPSGKTHRLTDPKSGQHVTLRYATKPQFTDQVQGDLIRKFSREIFPVVIGRLDWRTDPDLLDRGQKEPSLDYLRGYLAGLEGGYGQGQQSIRDEVKRTRERISKMEAQQNGISAVALAGGPISGAGPAAGPLNGPPPAAGAASVQLNEIPLSQRADNIAQTVIQRRLDEGVRRVRDAEDRGW